MAISGIPSEIKELSMHPREDDPLIIRIDNMIFSLKSLKCRLISEVRKHTLDGIERFVDIYHDFLQRVYYITSYLDQATSFMKKVDSRYDRKYEVLDRLKFWDSEEPQSEIFSLKYKGEEVRSYIRCMKDDHYKEIDNLIEKFEQIKIDILDGSEKITKHNINVVSNLEKKFKFLNGTIDFAIRDSLDIKSQNSILVKRINDIGDYIRDIVKDESLTELRTEYKKRLAQGEADSDKSSSVDIDIDIDIDIEEEEEQRVIIPDSLPNSLIVCNSQEKAIYVFNSNLCHKYDSIYEAVDTLEEISGSLEKGAWM